MKRKLNILITFALILLAVSNSYSQTNEPNFDSIYQRPIPSWFNEAKFGIFVVWGPYSVPSYVPKGYAEWYWKRSQNEKVIKDFQDRVYGKGFKYVQFAELLTAELWDPDLWCKLFAKSGARYVVTSANYHDGFAMYPTQYSETIGAKKWNSMEVGPKRDIIGELNKAGEKYNLKMGIYYSLTEWYHPWWENQRDKFVAEWLHPKFKEVVNRYKPWHIFLDGDWMNYKQWRSEELAHWLYTESEVKDFVVTNDRWGKPARGVFGDVFESEYGAGKYIAPDHPWQEDRGIGTSYSYNRMENIFDYDTRDELIRTYSNVVGGGGNFLLCVGPTADGRIPVIMQERLLQVGDWLKVNSEAIYGTTANPFWPRTFDWGTISKKPGKIFLHIHNPKLGAITINGISAKVNAVNVLTERGKIPVKFKNRKESLSLAWPSYLNDKAVTIIEMDVDDDYTVDKIQRQYSNGNVEFNIRAMTMSGDKAFPYYNGNWNRLWLSDWTDPEETLSIELIFDKSGTYDLSAIYAAGKKVSQLDPVCTLGGKFTIQIDNNELTGTIEASEKPETPEPKEIGTITIPKPGEYTLTLSPVNNGNWNGLRFQGIKCVLTDQQ